MLRLNYSRMPDVNQDYMANHRARSLTSALRKSSGWRIRATFPGWARTHRSRWDGKADEYNMRT